MKYQKQLDRLNSGTMSRHELAVMKKNAKALVEKGDSDTVAILDAIDYSKPADDYILFMGFCPGADFSQRLDIEWKKHGICRFDYLESESQLNRWNTLCAGDLVILKKREKFGESMKLYGYGRIKRIAYDEENTRYFEMDWSAQEQEIEVPLMGCNSTVDVKSMLEVEKQMPDNFWQWLNKE